VGISEGKTSIMRIGYLDSIAKVNVVPGTKKELFSLFVRANDGCTFQGDKEKLVVWNKSGKEIIHALRDTNEVRKESCGKYHCKI
jgi:hypothetical protein